jgi:hypothetical protein
LQKAGGSAAFHLLPAFGTEGHTFIEDGEAAPVWTPLVEKFLSNTGNLATQ